MYGVLISEHIGNLLFAETCLESFSQHLVLLLVETLSKNVQVIVIQPVGMYQEGEDDCCLPTSTLSNNNPSQISGKGGAVSRLLLLLLLDCQAYSLLIFIAVQGRLVVSTN